MKIFPVGAELFHAGGRADMTKLMVAPHNLVNAPKNLKLTCASLNKHTTNDVYGSGSTAPVFLSNVRFRFFSNL